ncbi:hypothetical protein LCGC14_0896130, partial [marine sediment metagenome]
TTVSALFARGIDAMRKGQTAYASSMVATTGDISKAMDQSQKYVTAVHDSYRSAHKMSGEYRVETKALQKAVDDLNDRFQTQIAVSGGMTNSIESMRKEALIMSKYLGTSMADVMDGWHERMQQSNLTLEESRKEMVRVAYQADKYAKEIGKLGDAYLKTGNIGKKEFAQMVRDVGKQFRTGTVQLDGYANALRGLLTETKKMGLSANEQRVAQEGMAKTVKSMFTMDSDLAIFGLKAAQQVREMWDDPKWLAQQDEQVQKRLKMVKKNFADEPVFVQQRAIMDVMRGSSAGSAMGMRMMANMSNLTLNRELIAKQTDGNILTADAIARQIQSGEAADKMEQTATKETKAQRDQQTSVWKKSIEDLVKASMTPKGRRYKMYAAVHKIQKEIEFIAKSTIWGAAATQGASLGKELLMMRMMRGGGGPAAKGGGLVARLFGGGAAVAAPAAATTAGTTVATTAGTTVATTAGTTAAGGVAAGMAGMTAAVVGAGLVGLAVGTLIDHGVGQAIAGGLFGEREAKIMELEGDATQSAFVSRKAMSLTHRGDKGWQMIEKERVFMEGQEYEKRRDMVRALEKRIKRMERHEKDLSAVDTAKLKALRKERDEINKSVGKRIEREKEESRLATIRLNVAQGKRIGDWMRRAEGGTANELARKLLTEKIGDQPTITDARSAATDVVAQYELLSPEVKQKFNIKEFAKAVDIQAGRLAIQGGDEMSKEEVITAFKEMTGETLGKDVSLLTADAAAREQLGRQARTQQAIELILGRSSGAGIEGFSDVTTNAKGEISFTTPGQTIRLRGLAPAVAAQNQKMKSKG